LKPEWKDRSFEKVLTSLIICFNIYEI
jgi:hypothetical protein